MPRSLALAVVIEETTFVAHPRLAAVRVATLQALLIRGFTTGDAKQGLQSQGCLCRSKGRVLGYALGELLGLFGCFGGLGLGQLGIASRLVDTEKTRLAASSVAKIVLIDASVGLHLIQELAHALAGILGGGVGA